MTKKALIFGCTGQDGSYLSELLLDKGYSVHGIIRRSSSFNTGRLDHIFNYLSLHYGDLTDTSSITKLIREIAPDEIYGLGAMSQVRTSFDIPEYTANSTALGTLRILEAMRIWAPEARFYQASSSEMFGSAPAPQSETTIFQPRSPYAVSKVFSYYTTVNYREAYQLHASNGILFNHECVTAETPVIIRKNGIINIVPIEEIVPHRTNPAHGKRYTTTPINTLEVWDKDKWTIVTCMTATWCKEDKKVRRISARGAIFETTADHIAFLKRADGSLEECPTGYIKKGDSLALGDKPVISSSTTMTEEEAWLLGALAGDGYVNKDGDVRLTGNDPEILLRGEKAWRSITGGNSHRWIGVSGYDGQDVTATNLTGDSLYGRWIRPQLYTERGDKRVPIRVLNADIKTQKAFLRGYNATDGLKAGHSVYEFKSFKTVSPCLAAGLWWLIQNALKQRAIICVENRGDSTYYTINLSCPDDEKEGNKGLHRRRPLEEVVKINDVPYTGWLFDLATESGTFHAGIGNGWIHNSPRRGETFVTKKITKAAVRILRGQQDKLFLGNLDARRDWGYAKDFVEAMYLMLQQEKPNDYVIATGETHTIREFLDAAFGYINLDWHRYVEFDERYLRPAEVDVLQGDPSRARKLLGWEAKIKFPELVKIMMEAELNA